MARMIPDELPPDTASQAEVLLFRHCREGLPADWTVYHSLPWLKKDGRRLRKGECDFLVFAPRAGLLAIEAKTAVERFDGRTGEWVQRVGDGRDKVIKDPVLQAANSIEELVRHARENLGLRRDDAFPLPYGHAAAFPDAQSLRGKLPSHVKPEILLFAQDLPRLEDRICGILSRYAPARATPLPRAQADALHAAILPGFRLIRDLGSHVADEKAALRRLTDFQQTALTAMVQQPRVLIEGCAGSGKTMLAAHRAVHLEHQGARVLLLCYNILLAEFLSARVHRAGGKAVTVRYFEQLCLEFASKAGLPHERPAKPTSHYYHEILPVLLLEAGEVLAQRYDAILVDEGQDFHPNFWPPVEALLADARSAFCIFHDPQQNVFGQQQQFPIAGPPARLPANCRNTQAIAAYAHRQIGVTMPTNSLCPPGLPVEVHTCRTALAERQAVRAVVELLVKQHGLTTRDIVILNPHTLKNSSLAEPAALGAFRLSEDRVVADRHTIAYRTIRRFKGLESPCVLLTGIRDHDPQCTPLDRYVAASRAKHLLHVFERSEG